MVYERDDVVGVDAAILMNPKVWEASGHVEAFADPLVECKTCHERFRADQPEEIQKHESIHKDKKDKVYLRGEITQGVHVNFKNVLDSTRVQIPFGIAQIGKAFRNEITPGNFTFRSREFEKMELQFYIKPQSKESVKWYDYWKEERMRWGLI